MPRRPRNAAFTLALAVAASLGGLSPPAQAEVPDWEPGQEVLRYQYCDFAEAAVRRSTPATSGAQSFILRDAVLVIPVAGLGSPNLWFTGGFGRNVSLGFTRFGADTPGLVPELNNRGLLVGTFHRFDSGQEFLGVLASGYFTAGSDYTVRPSTGGHALWRFPLSDREFLGLGASATSELGTPALVPLLEYRAWHPRWTAEARLPLDADMRWWPAEILSVGGVWQVRGGQYFAATGKLPYDAIRFTEGSLSAVLGIGARSGPQIELTVGRTLFRRYQALKDGRQMLGLDFAPAAVVTAKAAWRF